MVSQSQPKKDEFLNIISKTTNQRWFVKIKIKIILDFHINIIAFFNTGKYLNCIKEGIIPSKYFEKTKEKLSYANGLNLKIQHEVSNAFIEIQNQFYKISFAIVKNLTKYDKKKKDKILSFNLLII